jgi:hypothetical protein
MGEIDPNLSQSEHKSSSEEDSDMIYSDDDLEKKLKSKK